MSWINLIFFSFKIDKDPKLHAEYMQIIRLRSNKN